jgi:hypothetical protein
MLSIMTQDKLVTKSVLVKLTKTMLIKSVFLVKLDVWIVINMLVIHVNQKVM